MKRRGIREQGWQGPISLADEFTSLTCSAVSPEIKCWFTFSSRSIIVKALRFNSLVVFQTMRCTFYTFNSSNKEFMELTVNPGMLINIYNKIVMEDHFKLFKH